MAWGLLASLGISWELWDLGTMDSGGGGTPEAWESCAALYIMDSSQSALDLVSIGQLEKGVKSIFPNLGA